MYNKILLCLAIVCLVKCEESPFGEEKPVIQILHDAKTARDIDLVKFDPKVYQRVLNITRHVLNTHNYTREYCTRKRHQSCIESFNEDLFTLLSDEKVFNDFDHFVVSATTWARGVTYGSGEAYYMYWFTLDQLVIQIIPLGWHPGTVEP